MNRRLSHLAWICREFPLEEKVLLVPSSAAGEQIRRALARAGCPHVNLRVATTEGMARRLALPRMESQGIRPLPSLAGPFVLAGILDGLRARGEGYFSSLPASLGLLAALWKSLQDIRLAGLSSADLRGRASVFVSERKAGELARLAEGFEKYLEEKRLADRGIEFLLALEAAGEEKGSPDAVYLLPADLRLCPLEQRLVERAAGERLILLSFDSPEGLTIPSFYRRPGGEGKVEKPDLPLLYLYKPGSAPSRISGLSAFRALGEVNEVREAVRRILAEETSLDQVEIVVSDREAYIPLFLEECGLLEIPVTFGPGIPFRSSRYGRAALGILAWMAEGYPAGKIASLVGEGILRCPRSDEEGFSPAALASLLRSGGIGWGRDRYASLLIALSKRFTDEAVPAREEGEEERAERLARDAAAAGILAGDLADLLAGLPSADTVFLGGLAQALRECLGRFAVRFDPDSEKELDRVEHSAARALAGAALAIGGAALPEEGIGEAIGHLAAVLESLWIRQATPRAGRLYVTDLSSAGYSGRPCIFVLGLAQDRFPGTERQDPVLLDREREGIDGGLLLRSGEPVERIFGFASLLAGHRGSVTLSYPCWDLLEDRERFPAAILLQACRLAGGDPERGWSDLAAWLGEPVGFAACDSVRSLRGSEPYLAAAAAGADRNKLLRAVHLRYLSMARGHAASQARHLPTPTPYDGVLSRADSSLDPGRRGHVTSASRLETLAICPFRYFLRCVLGVMPLERIERDPGRWLDPVRRGSLYHELFCRLMRVIRERGETPSEGKHALLLKELLQEVLAEEREKTPVPGEAIYEAEVREFERTARFFLQEEERRAKEGGGTCFELSFGMGEGAAVEPLSSPEPVAVEFPGVRILLAGRIDRIDRAGEHDYEVWDYKTGGSGSIDPSDPLANGRQLQPLLYARAAGDLLQRKDRKARVVRSGYYFPGDRGAGERILFVPAPDAQAAPLLVNLRRIAAGGAFLPFPAKRPGGGAECEYCEYREVCGDAEFVRGMAARKLESGSGEGLEALRGLRG